MKIERFEDIDGWKKARILTQQIYLASSTGGLARDFGLRDQMRSASTSVMSNIAEGFERGGDKEFAQFLPNAEGSCGEVRSQLYVALDQRYILQPTFDDLYVLSTETSRLISGFMRYLSDSPYKGSKYK